MWRSFTGKFTGSSQAFLRSKSGHDASVPPPIPKLCNEPRIQLIRFSGGRSGFGSVAVGYATCGKYEPSQAITSMPMFDAHSTRAADWRAREIQEASKPPRQIAMKTSTMTPTRFGTTEPQKGGTHGTWHTT